MCFKRVLVITFLATSVVAAPAACGPGRSASKDACCKWLNVLDDLQDDVFEGSKCGEVALDALRLSFHDAIGFSQQAQSAGQFGGNGADGSIMHFPDIELNFHANKGLAAIVESEREVAIKHGVSFADIVQFSAAVGVANCGGGPRLQFLAGRSNNTRPAPDLTVPEPSDSADKIFARMSDAGFTPKEVVALLASHSTAVQEHVDPTIPGTPFDSTVGTFDTQFFLETLLNGTEIPGNGLNVGEALSPLPGEFRLQSDLAIARDSRTACEWQSFITDHDTMIIKFERVMAKLAVLGQGTSGLVDCSDVVPVPSRAKSQKAVFPAGKTKVDVVGACANTPFPSLSTAPGPQTSIAPLPHDND